MIILRIVTVQFCNSIFNSIFFKEWFGLVWNPDIWDYGDLCKYNIGLLHEILLIVLKYVERLLSEIKSPKITFSRLKPPKVA